jgi:uncharacterized membrane protein YkoI
MLMIGKAVIIAGAVFAFALPAASSAAIQAPQDQAPKGDSLGADWREQQNEARQKVKEGRHLPLDKIITEIRRKTPGRLLDTGLEQGPGGRTVYRVRWAAANGRRIDFLVDAQSGAIVGSEGK